MNKTPYILGGLLLIVAIAGALLLINNDSDDGQDQAADQQVVSETPSETSQPADVPGDEQELANAEVVNLESVRDTTESGVAERAFNNGTYVLNVTAELNPPGEGKFYEGWVVGNGEVISTGELVLENGNTYAQTFTADQDLLPQTRVVITEETLANGFDDIPEDHVIEGTF